MRNDGTPIIRNAFARELAAFFGVGKLNFPQDIFSLMYKIHDSRTEFMDYMRVKIEKYFIQRCFQTDCLNIIKGLG